MLDKMYERLAWWLPRRLVYWCAIRVWCAATVGPWAHEETPAVLCSTALQRWR